MVEQHREIDADLIDQGTEYSLGQFCRMCRLDPEAVVRLVEEGVIVAKGEQPDNWVFSFRMVTRLKRAYRLHRDLDLNLPGVALSVELLDEIDRLRGELARLRKRLQNLD